MAVRIVNFELVPKRKRRAIPRVMQTPDWTVILSRMAKGLKHNEAILFTLTPEELARYQIKNIRAAARPIRQHIKTYGLPYVVSAKNTAEGGMIVIRGQSKE
jgi:hypothetical protein